MEQQQALFIHRLNALDVEAQRRRRGISVAPESKRI
jgi:hypothetical protein